MTRFLDLCVAKLASAPEIRDFRADAAVRQGDAYTYVPGLTSR